MREHEEGKHGNVTAALYAMPVLVKFHPATCCMKFKQEKKSLNFQCRIPRGYSLYWLIRGGSAQKGSFFRLQVYKRVGISQVEVYKRVGKSVVSQREVNK